MGLILQTTRKVVSLAGRGARGAIGIDIQGDPADLAGKVPQFIGGGGRRAVAVAISDGDDTALRASLGAPTGAMLVTHLGDTVADYLDNGIADRALQVRDVQPGSIAKVASLDFAQSIVGEMPEGIRLNGGATAVIVAGGAAAIMAAYNDPTKRAITIINFAEGMLQFQVLRGVDNGHSSFMVTIVGSDGRARAIWSGDGATLSYGYLDAAGNPAVLGTGGTFYGGANQLVNIELMTPPIYPGLTWYVRSWVDGGTRPADNAAMTSTYPTSEPANAAGNKINQGRVAVASIGANPAQIARFRSNDGQRGTKLTSKAAQVGPWFSRYDGGRLIMASNQGSASLRLLSAGTNDLVVDYVTTPDGGPVVLDAFVDGVRAGAPLVLDGAGGSPNTKGWQLGMDPGGVRQVEIVVRGVDVFSNMWYRGSAALIEDIRPSIATARLSPWQDPSPLFGLLSDSIGAGAVARGTSSNPIDYGGDIAWHRLACRASGWQPWIRALGGTGATVPIDPAGGGTSPSAMDHGFNYMQGRPIDTGALNLRALTIQLGTNDASRGVSAADFKAGYKALVAKALRAHPGLGAVLLMYPLNQSFAAQIFEARGELADPRIVLVDTSSWTEITYTDRAPPNTAKTTPAEANGVHPDVAGHAAIAARMASIYRTVLSGALV